MLAAIMLPSIAQTLTPSVRATTGGVTTGGGGSLSATMGETFIATYSSGSAMLTQGEQQPEVTFKTGVVSTSICVGNAVTVPFTLKGIFGATHTITAQLSNASGSFASPVSIGSTVTGTSGSISATIPSNTTPGSGYRIRVVCTSPALVASNNGTNISINGLPTASVTGNNVLCRGGVTTLLVTATGGNGTYTNTGSYTNISAGGPYNYTVTDGVGCTSTTSISITQPATNVTASNTVPTQISCMGGTTWVLVSGSGGTGTLTGIGSFTRTAGAYTFTVTDHNGCTATTGGTLSQPTTVTFTATVTNPSPCTASNGRITLMGAGGSGFYSFSKDGGTNWVTSNQFLSLPTATYVLQVKDSRLCLSAQQSKRVGCLARIEDQQTTDIASSWTVFPNPAYDHITIEFNTSTEESYSVKLTDVTGRVVVAQEHNSVLGENQIQVNLDQIAKGVYMLAIQKGETSLNKKIVIQ